MAEVLEDNLKGKSITLIFLRAGPKYIDPMFGPTFAPVIMLAKALSNSAGEEGERDLGRLPGKGVNRVIQ